MSPWTPLVIKNLPNDEKENMDIETSPINVSMSSESLNSSSKLEDFEDSLLLFYIRK